jgi:hypothetical protein
VAEKVVGEALFGAFIIKKNPKFGDSMACMMLADNVSLNLFFLVLNHRSKVVGFWIHL